MATVSCTHIELIADGTVDRDSAFLPQRATDLVASY